MSFSLDNFKLPLLEHEVELKIDFLKLVNQKATNEIKSEVRTTNRFQWNLMVFPCGNVTDSHISVFVECLPDNLSFTNWYFEKIRYTVTALNFKDIRKSFTKSDTFNFNFNESDRGWNDFMPKETIVSDGFLSPSGILTLRASVSAPNPEYMRSTSTVSTRSHINYVGLCNQGATCYLNGLLQSFYHLPKFREIVYKLPIIRDDEYIYILKTYLRNKSIDDNSSELQHIIEEANSRAAKLKNQQTTMYDVAVALLATFIDLETCREPVHTNDLIRSFGWTSLEAFTQHDAQELSRILLDKLENHLSSNSIKKKLSEHNELIHPINQQSESLLESPKHTNESLTPENNPIKSLFAGEVENFIECTDIDFKSNRVEIFYDLSLNVVDEFGQDTISSLEESFKHFLSVEILEGDNAYEADGHSEKQRAKKGTRIKSMPPVLNIQLKRSTFDFETLSMIKVHNKLSYPTCLKIDEVLKESTDFGDYLLQSVLVHSGDVHSGHYYSFIRPDILGKPDLWLRFDDDQVTISSEYGAVNDNFGGDFYQAIDYYPRLTQASNELSDINRFGVGQDGFPPHAIKHFKTHSAYMLMYVSEKRIKEICHPVKFNLIDFHRQTESLRNQSQSIRHNIIHKISDCRIYEILLTDIPLPDSWENECNCVFLKMNKISNIKDEYLKENYSFLNFKNGLFNNDFSPDNHVMDDVILVISQKNVNLLYYVKEYRNGDFIHTGKLSFHPKIPENSKIIQYIDRDSDERFFREIIDVDMEKFYYDNFKMKKSYLYDGIYPIPTIIVNDDVTISPKSKSSILTKLTKRPFSNSMDIDYNKLISINESLKNIILSTSISLSQTLKIMSQIRHVNLLIFQSTGPCFPDSFKTESDGSLSLIDSLNDHYEYYQLNFTTVTRGILNFIIDKWSYISNGRRYPPFIYDKDFRLFKNAKSIYSYGESELLNYLFQNDNNLYIYSMNDMKMSDNDTTMIDTHDSKFPIIFKFYKNYHSGPIETWSSPIFWIDKNETLLDLFRENRDGICELFSDQCYSPLNDDNDVKFDVFKAIQDMDKGSGEEDGLWRLRLIDSMNGQIFTPYARLAENIYHLHMYFHTTQTQDLNPFLNSCNIYPRLAPQADCIVEVIVKFFCRSSQTTFGLPMVVTMDVYRDKLNLDFFNFESKKIKICTNSNNVIGLVPEGDGPTIAELADNVNSAIKKITQSSTQHRLSNTPDLVIRAGDKFICKFYLSVDTVHPMPSLLGGLTGGVKGLVIK